MYAICAHVVIACHWWPSRIPPTVPAMLRLTTQVIDLLASAERASRGAAEAGTKTERPRRIVSPPRVGTKAREDVVGVV
jgi:hypothetical protein